MVVSNVWACGVLELALVLMSYSALASFHTASRGSIGVDYGLNGDNLPTPEQAVNLIRSRGITRVRTYEARPDITRAFAHSGIDLTIGVPNEEVPKLAVNLGEAFSWVIKYVLAFPTSGISTIMVGNEWLSDPSNDPSLLVPAMQHIYIALSTLRLFHWWICDIKVSTPHSFAVLSSPSFPPSTATFTDASVPVMRPLLDFLEKTGSFFVVNIFPYFAYLADDAVSLEFALFESTEAVTDPNTGLQYSNLFDLQLDAVYAAIASLLSSSSNCSQPANMSDERVHSEAAARPARRPTTRVKAGETGWGSGGGSADSAPHLGRPHPQVFSSEHPITLHNHLHSHASLQNATHTSSGTLPSATATQAEVEAAGRCTCAAATVENAKTYNQNLIRHVLRAKGTPAHPKTPISVYIFELFNEDLKPAGPEQHFGLFFPNGTAVYPITFTGH